MPIDPLPVFPKFDGALYRNDTLRTSTLSLLSFLVPVERVSLQKVSTPFFYPNFFITLFLLLYFRMHRVAGLLSVPKPITTPSD